MFSGNRSAKEINLRKTKAPTEIDALVPQRLTEVTGGGTWVLRWLPMDPEHEVPWQRSLDGICCPTAARI